MVSRLVYAETAFEDGFEKRHRNPEKRQKESICGHKTFAEFFAGIGLMRMGLEKEDWKATFANDISPDKFELYSEHFGENTGLFLIADLVKAKTVARHGQLYFQVVSAFSEQSWTINILTN